MRIKLANNPPSNFGCWRQLLECVMWGEMSKVVISECGFVKNEDKFNFRPFVKCYNPHYRTNLKSLLRGKSSTVKIQSSCEETTHWYPSPLHPSSHPRHILSNWAPVKRLLRKGGAESAGSRLIWGYIKAIIQVQYKFSWSQISSLLFFLSFL